jgi:uncharacterized protein YxeA
MLIKKAKIIEILKTNLFKIIYLILLIVLLAFIAKNGKPDNDNQLNSIEKDQLVKENEK